ncbi:hypothetical protein FA048_01995 [Pedobacter polaris]|uniref:TolB-like 6-blade propeller-like n=1 Tax=Pedobacter polaris TaxID=2571273 RepID=A0A4U1CUA8_9SPHI|nr:BF3164 family lipoprotein [Pedobacter polaris]TKC12413.1 hypothetical protein FA048_01995 [Pedobacter polaris]
MYFTQSNSTMRITFVKTLLLVSLVIIGNGCDPSRDEEDPLNDFITLPKKSLVGTDIILKSDSVLYDPRTIHVFDSLAICYDNNGYTAFSIVNLNNGSLVRRFAQTGSGENQYNINSLGLNRIIKDQQHFTVYEASTPHRFFKFDLDSLIKDSHYAPRLISVLPTEFTFIDPILQSDSIITGNISFSQLDSKVIGRYNVINKKLITGIDLAKSQNDIFKEYYDIDNIGWTKSVLGGKLAAHPKGREIANFSARGAMYQIFNIKENNPKLIKEKLYYLPRFKILDLGHGTMKSKFTPTNRYGFNNITVTNDFIFALFNGKLTETSEANSLSSNIILVYDWNGNPVRKIILDKDCYQIAIDPQNANILYALTAFKNVGIRKFTLD